MTRLIHTSQLPSYFTTLNANTSKSSFGLSAQNWWQTETQLPKPLAFVFLMMLFQSVYI